MNKGQYQLFLGIIVLTSVAASIGILYYYSFKLNLPTNKTIGTTTTAIVEEPSCCCKLPCNSMESLDLMGCKLLAVDTCPEERAYSCSIAACTIETGTTSTTTTKLTTGTLPTTTITSTTTTSLTTTITTTTTIPAPSAYIVAHFDDDTNFMGANMYNDSVVNKQKVYRIGLMGTNNKPFPSLSTLENESLSVSKYLSEKAGRTSSLINDTLVLPSGNKIVYFTDGYVYTIFMRLASGNMVKPADVCLGDSIYCNHTFERFWKGIGDTCTGQVREMRTDKVFTYTSQKQLIDDLEALLKWTGAKYFHIQTNDANWGQPALTDHCDHIYGSYFVKAALAQMQSSYNFEAYEHMSYPSGSQPKNLDQFWHDVEKNMTKIFASVYPPNEGWDRYFWRNVYKPATILSVLEFFLNKPAKRVGFDNNFSVRRVSTLCPFAFDNPNVGTRNWCNTTDEENSKTYFNSFLDPSPISPVQNIGRGFYSLSVSNNSGLHQICKVNEAGCGYSFEWKTSSEGGNQADLILNTMNLPHDLRVGYYEFGNKIINRDGNIYAGSWNHPLITNSGTRAKVSGKILSSDQNQPSSHSRFIIITGFSNPTSRNYYEIDINLGTYGQNPTTGCCDVACSTSGCSYSDAWSPTQKYALYRMAPYGKGNITEIYIGAQAWGLPVLDLSTGEFKTYDIDWSSIVNQMVQEGYIKASDLVINLTDAPPSARDLQYWGAPTGFGIETQGGVSSKYSIKDYVIYNFTSS